MRHRIGSKWGSSRVGVLVLRDFPGPGWPVLCPLELVLAVPFGGQGKIKINRNI